MKKFMQEFKTFISRGNVMDMAVGTIIGSAFTAIVTALSSGILKPLINFVIYLCCGGDSDALSKMYTVLGEAVYTTDADGNSILDLTNTIYIDWGAFISAIINFLLIAIVLFCIVKAFNRVRENNENLKNNIKGTDSPFTKEELRAMKKAGKTKAEIAAAEDARRAELQAEAARKEEEAKLNAPKTQEQLLAEILEELKSQKAE